MRGTWTPRSKGIEPFDFEEADVSDELWFGEGFTNYFDTLILERARLVPLEALLADFAGTINTVTLSPGRQIRSAVEMSRLAPFVDAAASIDRTAWPNLFISYYTYGAAIAMGLDLSLRDRTDGKLTLDTYMRALWRKYGRTANQTPGVVPSTYTIRDLENTLPVAIVNQFAAERWWRRQDPVGRTVRVDTAEAKPPLVLTVVGVVADNRAASANLLLSDPGPELYLAYEQAPSAFPTFLIRADAGPTPLLKPVRDWHAHNFDELARSRGNPSRAVVVLLAIDGLWLSELLQTSPLTAVERRRLRSELESLALSAG
jgi:hypothetical protein